MKTIKFSLLILGLFFWSHGFSQCFIMAVAPTEASSKNQQCYLISVTVDDGTPTDTSLEPGYSVRFADGIHTNLFCPVDCSFTWCYDVRPEPYSVTIGCNTVVGPKLSCYQYDSCIVIVGQ